ncbi:uncharacterized protein UBRO2_06047 [Ustilago bromivora]|uniref:Uncharacterized protein n=1 Tax=Ustilago bromivora TaxID=307758 RepID=A0A8H8QSL1_9BASI|nr:uncharacterized protein UBRO2_06047 [Ustilago bromivora]
MGPPVRDQESAQGEEEYEEDRALLKRSRSGVAGDTLQNT